MEVKYIYDSGYPFTIGIQLLCKTLKNRIEENKASLLIIDGLQGMGKTTLAVEIADYINNLHGLPPIKLKIKEHPQLAMGGKDFIKCLNDCNKEKLPVLIYDEAGDFNRRGAMGRLNAVLVNVFQKFRAFKILIILCLPNMNMLDNYLFDCGIPRALIHIPDRNKHSGEYRIFSLSQINWIRYHFDKLPKGIKNKCYTHTFPNMYGHFLNLPPDREKQLDNISTKSKEQSIIEEELKLDGLITIDTIQKSLGRSKIWIWQNLKKLKIKPKKKVGTKVFYEESILQLLEERKKTRA